MLQAYQRSSSRLSPPFFSSFLPPVFSLILLLLDSSLSTLTNIEPGNPERRTKMTVPLQMNGVEAWITVENNHSKVRVQQYAPEFDAKAGVATCWISGEPGQVRLSLTSLYHPSIRSAPYMLLIFVYAICGVRSRSSFFRLCLRSLASIDPIIIIGANFPLFYTDFCYPLARPLKSGVAVPERPQWFRHHGWLPAWWKSPPSSQLCAGYFFSHRDFSDLVSAFDFLRPSTHSRSVTFSASTSYCMLIRIL